MVSNQTPSRQRDGSPRPIIAFYRRSVHSGVGDVFEKFDAIFQALIETRTTRSAMSDAAAPQTAAPAAAPAKKAAAAAAGAKKAKSKDARSKPSHPPTSEMVNNAIKSLKERGGSSLQAIKKYLAANYKVDAEKLSPFIKKYLKASVASGALVQTKGKGASGSFKLASSSKPEGSSVAPKAAKRGAAKAKSPAKKKPKAAAAAAGAEKKSAAKPRKPASEKKAAAAAASAPKAKSPSKVKKSNKGPTKKPKAPKPKKAKASPAKAKKAAASKKK